MEYAVLFLDAIDCVHAVSMVMRGAMVNRDKKNQSLILVDSQQDQILMTPFPILLQMCDHDPES